MNVNLAAPTYRAAPPARRPATANTPAHIARMVKEITQRVGDLLCAQIAVVDAHGTILSCNELPHWAGSPFHLLAQQERLDCVRVPLCLDNWMGEVIVGESLNEEAVSPRLVQALVELVISQALLHDRLPNQHELKNEFIHDLLYDLIKDEETILQKARLLKLDFTLPRAVILIDAAAYILGSADEDSHLIQRRAQFVVGNVVNFFHLPNDTICAYIGDGEVAVLKASDTKSLVNWVDSANDPDPSSASWANLTALKRAGDRLLERLRHDTGASINIGLGRYHPGIRGLARSYQDARAALSLGRRFNGHNRVYCLDRLGVAAFVGVSDEQTKIELATHLLSPLNDETELLQTLAVFFEEDCCPSSTANRLSIHRNTLSYRLDKITSLSGLDPRRFDDAVQIRLSLLLRSLTAETAIH